MKYLFRARHISVIHSTQGSEDEDRKIEFSLDSTGKTPISKQHQTAKLVV